MYGEGYGGLFRRIHRIGGVFVCLYAEVRGDSCFYGITPAGQNCFDGGDVRIGVG